MCYKNICYDSEGRVVFDYRMSFFRSVECRIVFDYRIIEEEEEEEEEEDSDGGS